MNISAIIQRIKNGERAVSYGEFLTRKSEMLGKARAKGEPVTTFQILKVLIADTASYDSQDFQSCICPPDLAWEFMQKCRAYCQQQSKELEADLKRLIAEGELVDNLGTKKSKN